MEVDRTSFPSELMTILETISKAHFVAIDFEFSGVVSNIKPNGRVKQTIQERYAEVKQAAERYQILQIGITCAKEDVEGDRYELQTYNFHLSPLLDEDLEVERIFAFQSGAVDFLLRNNFRIEQPFTTGIQYISRQEEADAKQKAISRLDKSRFQDIQLTEEDTQALAFLNKVRHDIDRWLKTGKPSFESLPIISRSRHWSVDPMEHELTGFDKRLVHQLVRAEYPGLVTTGSRASVNVSRFDAKKEKLDQSRLTQRFSGRINKHIGFRWIIEALCGGSIQDINLRSLAYDWNGDHVDFEFYEYTRRHTEVVKALEARRPILVGHNIFSDLVYLYQCFVGDLPDTVTEFQTKIKELFPFVVDTKYMATHNCGDMSPASSLEQIHDTLSSQRQPEIQMNARFSKYDKAETLHEAGYDSFITARIMILLSAKLSSTNDGSVKGKGNTDKRVAMPALDSDFWKEYGNRLRVFGTFEAFLDLDPDRKGLESLDGRSLPIR